VDDVATFAREKGDGRSMVPIYESLREDMGRLERVLGGMREMIGEGGSGGGRDGDGKAFLVGGRWATLL
jgi:hypothetical protein